jgi:hypothetical protein
MNQFTSCLDQVRVLPMVYLEVIVRYCSAPEPNYSLPKSHTLNTCLKVTNRTLERVIVSKTAVLGARSEVDKCSMLCTSLLDYSSRTGPTVCAPNFVEFQIVVFCLFLSMQSCSIQLFCMLEMYSTCCIPRSNLNPAA